jgi:hypothetical protein
MQSLRAKRKALEIELLPFLSKRIAAAFHALLYISHFWHRGFEFLRN